MQTILTADDNDDLRDMLGQFLAANGYRVAGAADGRLPTRPCTETQAKAARRTSRLIPYATCQPF